MKNNILSLIILISGTLILNSCHFSAEPESILEIKKNLQIRMDEFVQKENIWMINQAVWENGFVEALDTLPVGTQNAIAKDSALNAGKSELIRQNNLLKAQFIRSMAASTNMQQALERWVIELPNRNISKQEQMQYLAIQEHKWKKQMDDLDGISNKFRKIKQLQLEWVQKAVRFKVPKPVYYYPVYQAPSINP